MPIPINATPGAADANSYATEAEAAAYANTRLNLSGWVSVAAPLTDNERRALIEATRELDVLEYRGARATDTQALEWPRTDVPSNLATPDSIPGRLRTATIELAIQFLKAGPQDLAGPNPDQGVIRKKLDVIETEWEKSGTRPEGMARFPRVLSLIAPLLASAEITAEDADDGAWVTLRGLR